MTHEEVLTLKAAVLYILNKADKNLDKYRIYKSLYFANKEHLNKYGRLITSDTFFALPYGPVPTKLGNILDHIQGKKKMSEKDKSLFIPIISSLSKLDYDAENTFHTDDYPDMDELSESDIECLDYGVSKCLNRNFTAIKDESHDKAWEKASQKEKSKAIDILDMIDDSNAEMREYVIDNMYCH